MRHVRGSSGGDRGATFFQAAEVPVMSDSDTEGAAPNSQRQIQVPRDDPNQPHLYLARLWSSTLGNPPATLLGRLFES